jgi:AcrR family transcriptional regulator
MKRPGRGEQAVRNNEAILTAAREIFLADPRAPVAAVADRAKVGIGALYRRYPSKEELLRTICHDGLRTFIAEAERAGLEPDDWVAFATFLRGIVRADVHSLTVHLAGTFTPTEQMHADAMLASELAGRLVERARPHLRAEIGPADVTLLLEMCAAVRAPDATRTAELRERCLTILLDGLRADGPLPGPPPTAAELNWRWPKA